MKKQKTFYHGPSMNPTLIVPDLLELSSYENFQQIKIGDIVVFVNPASKAKQIVHRVVSILASGIRTRGDNNNKIDDFIVSFTEIIGRVNVIIRGNKRLVVSRGIKARLYMVYVRARRLVINNLFNLLIKPYNWLVQLGLLSGFFKGKLRIVVFRSHKGEERQLLFGQRVIGRFLPDHKRWQIYRPWGLVVDEKSLGQ